VALSGSGGWAVAEGLSPLGAGASAGRGLGNGIFAGCTRPRRRGRPSPNRSSRFSGLFSGLAAAAGPACIPSKMSAAMAVTMADPARRMLLSGHLRCPFSAIMSMTIPRSGVCPPISQNGKAQANNIRGGNLDAWFDAGLAVALSPDHRARGEVSWHQEVVTRSVEGPIVRTNYAEIHKRALKVSQMLQRDGIKFGDRVATIAWNTARHLECWYGIMGIGAICHTVNPRLFPEQIAWIINHAEDRVVLTDLTFVPILEKLADKLPTVERFIVLTDKEHMPQTTLKNAVAYEEWLKQASGDFAWDDFDENTAAAMCYTSGTTGDPKGVLYSHRSNVLHTFMANA